MKWITHQTVGVMAALALGMPGVSVTAAWAGSVMPDVLDQKIAGIFRNKQRAFNRIHRGATHWFGLWLGLWFAAYVIPWNTWEYMPKALGGVSHDVLAGLGFGGLSHVVLDMCTPAGVPLVPWSRKNKVSLKLCKTGSLGEYCFLAGSMVLFALFFRTEGLNAVNSILRFF